MNFIEELLEAFRNPPDAEGRGDPRAGVGTLTPLLVKFHAHYQGAPVGDAMQNVTTAAGLPNIPPDAASVTIQVQGNPVRYTFTGTTPTPAVGLRADANATLTLRGMETLRGVQFVQEGAGAVTLAIVYWS